MYKPNTVTKCDRQSKLDNLSNVDAM